MSKIFKRSRPKHLIKSNPELVLAIDGKTVYHFKGYEYTFNYTHSEGEQEFMLAKIKADPLCHVAKLIYAE